MLHCSHDTIDERGEDTLLLRDVETTSFRETVHNWPRRNYIDLSRQWAPQPEDFEEQMDIYHMSQDDEISEQDQAEEQNVPMMTPRSEQLLTETPAPPQHPIQQIHQVNS